MIDCINNSRAYTVGFHIHQVPRVVPAFKIKQEKQHNTYSGSKQEPKKDNGLSFKDLFELEYIRFQLLNK